MRLRFAGWICELVFVWAPLVLFVGVLAASEPAASPAGQDGRAITEAEALREYIADLKALIARLEARLAVLEAGDDRPTRPGSGERPAPPDDRPLLDPARWPAPPRVTATMDRLSLVVAPPEPRGWVAEEADDHGLAWRYAIERRRLGDLMLLVAWEQFDGVDATRVTAAAINGFAGTGAVLFDDLGVTAAVGGASTDLIGVVGDLYPGTDAIQVRGILAGRGWIGPEAALLADYEHAPLAEGYPAWTEEVAGEGLTDALTSGVRVLGPYRIGEPGVKGASSLNGSHGGWAVAPWHLGPEGWQRSTRAGWRWAEAAMFNTLDRSPLAVFDRETLRPKNPHVPYWPGRVAVTLPGFAPDPNPACAYLPELEQYEAHAYSHLHRQTAAAAMLAPRDVFARWLLVEVYWHDIALWLDGAESGNELLKPLRQVMRELPSKQGWGNGGRGFAHSVRCYLYARPYFPWFRRDDMEGPMRGYRPDRLSDGGEWAELIPALIRHTARPNGIIHSTPQDSKFPAVKPSARAREVDLMYPNLHPLGLDDIAAACRATMARVDGVSVAEAFDPTGDSWAAKENATPGYYPPYDWIRGEALDEFDATKRWAAPLEQAISMVPPELIPTLVSGSEERSER